MSTDVIARLAAANPFPHETPAVRPARSGRRRLAVALVAAAVVAAPAAAFAGKLGEVLGIGNQGTTVARSDVLPGYSQLDQAMQELNVGSTMQLLGTLNGVSFYAARNSEGHFCFAVDHVGQQYDKGFGCFATADGFPSAQVQALTFPPAIQLEGIAADGVATVEFLDASGTVIDSAPVTNNLFASGKQLSPGEASSIVTLDANGNVTSTRQLP